MNDKCTSVRDLAMVNEETKEERKRRLMEEGAKQGIPSLSSTDSEEGYLRWLGGFFDGEGCVSISEMKKFTGYPFCYTLAVEIGGNFKEVLEEIQERFEGTLSPTENSEFSWRLQLSANKALHFLETIRPYVRLKWEEVDVGIDFQRNMVKLWRGTPKSIVLSEMRRRERLSYRVQFLNRVRNLGPRVE